MEPDLNPSISQLYNDLPRPPGVVQAEYVWIGEKHLDFRSKSRTLNMEEVTSLKQIPVWEFDGSMTKQAPKSKADVVLKPVSFFKDPWRTGNSILVLCECCLPDHRSTPLPNNTRRAATKVFAQAEDEEVVFGFTQSFSMLSLDLRTPLGWPKGGTAKSRGQAYGGVGTGIAFGRSLAQAHMNACLYAGLKMAAFYPKQTPSRWEYIVGPCRGIRAADELVMSRYILIRTAEDFDVVISFLPNIIPGPKSAVCYTTFSTAAMRAEKGGFDAILEVIAKLGRRHKEHVGAYGLASDENSYQTPAICKFSYGISHKRASISIPRKAKLAQAGHLKDRRPPSNMDPYIVTAKIVMTACLD